MVEHVCSKRAVLIQFQFSALNYEHFWIFNGGEIFWIWNIAALVKGAFRFALIIPITNSAPQYTTLQVYTTWKNTKTGIAFLKWTCFTVQSYDFLKINIMSSVVYHMIRQRGQIYVLSYDLWFVCQAMVWSKSKFMPLKVSPTSTFLLWQ